METYLTHWHEVVFSPRNKLAEEQANLLYEEIKHLPGAKIDKNSTTHVTVRWRNEAVEMRRSKTEVVE